MVALVGLDPIDVERLTALLPGVVGNPYIPTFPHPAQAEMLICEAAEVLFGGSAGGGKTIGVMIDALRDVATPGYSSLVLRKTFTDLSQPGCPIPVSHEWLAGTDAHWDGTLMRWRFPSGASLSFGYLDGPQDHLRYQGAQFQAVFFDELTQHREAQYRYLFSRLRRPSSGPASKVRVRMRSTSNPGGPGHDWVKRDFLDFPFNEETGERRVFIPSKIADNPSLDVDAYRRSLARLDPVTRRQLEDGDWTARHGGSLFRREWFRVLPKTPWSAVRVRAWDLAASTGPDAKRTVGVRMAKTFDGKLYVEHVVAGRWAPGDRDEVIRQTAEADGPTVRVVVEQEPGSGGMAQAEAIIRLLRGFRVEAVKPSGSKFVRAGPVASAAQIGDVALIDAGWDIAGYLDELEAANPAEPEGRQYLDRMDATSSAFEALVPLSAGPIPPPPKPESAPKAWTPYPGGRLRR